jgi:D-beta-D-heptose 7-phosphate kinase/D-beta-D-heptose 1-phosphate adenosyltransferase
MDTQPQKKFNILLVGDDCQDVYVYGTVDRLSPEAPVPVFVPAHEQRQPGMAGNVCRNLQQLGCQVNYLQGSTSIKTRLIDSRSKQQIVRVDQDMISDPIVIDSELPQTYDAIVISDYNKGAVSYELISQLRQDFSGPMFLDTKKTDLALFHGIFVKINELEYHRRVSINHSLIVTLGARGAMYSTGRDPKYHTTYPAPEVEVADVCGAGDTFLAALAWAYLHHAGDITSAIQFAIRASAVTVQHIGCYAPTLEEIACV